MSRNVLLKMLAGYLIDTAFFLRVHKIQRKNPSCSLVGSYTANVLPLSMLFKLLFVLHFGFFRVLLFVVTTESLHDCSPIRCE